MVGYFAVVANPRKVGLQLHALHKGESSAKAGDMQQLDASILREFVDKIYISEVYTPDENEPRIKVREIEIVYNFIGAFDFEEAREQSQAAQKEKKTGVA